MEIPDRIYVELDADTNEKRWFSTKGMGIEYVKAANPNMSVDAWLRNAVEFIREKGLEIEFTDWCGGWKCPIDKKSKQ